MAPYRASLATVAPYRAGRPLPEVQRSLGLERLVKLASNEHPFPPLPAVERVLQDADESLNRYPDGAGLDLRTALAERLEVPVEQIVLGNGADELIRLCGLITLEPGDRAVLGWPSFPTFVAAAATLGAEPVKVPLTDYRYDLEAMLAAIDSRTRLVFVCNPNNPTGTPVPPGELIAFLDALPEHVLCVLDEAYFEYVDDPLRTDGVELVLAGRPRLVVLRTFSKAYGLAGLRVGYAIGEPEAIDALDRVRNVFNVNQLAQDCARAALGEEREVASRIERIQIGRSEIEAVLEMAGFDVAPSQTNFVYADTGGDGTELALELLRAGVMIRALPGFGVEGAVRVTVGEEDENVFFAKALRQVTQAETVS